MRLIRWGVVALLVTTLTGAGCALIESYGWGPSAPDYSNLPPLDYPAPNDSTSYYGYRLYEFFLEGRACKIVAPHTVAIGRPWVWRARFWGHEPQTELELLNRGFHLVYIDVSDMFGGPEAVELWNTFYRYLTGKLGFARRPALIGMSRGGLIVYNWAAANPDKVACIYADAPVCDIKSWPGPDDRVLWRKCLTAYKLANDEAGMAFQGNPVDNLKPLARAGVPLLHVCGDADEVVPMEENTRVVESRYRALGGSIQVIVKPGVGHHPHSLKEPEPIVSFIFAHTLERNGIAFGR